MNDLKIKIKKNRAAFSNYNMVRMREAIRYLTKKKLQIFIKIPFLLHINSPRHPGFIDTKVSAHGIWNFESSGFYKEAVKTKIFPKSIIENTKVDTPAVMGFYHIGSLGTFTQSKGSDFDYWVIIDKKRFSKERYECLEQKLDTILKYSREEYDQEVTFFIMDQKDIKNDCYAPFKGEETITAPKIFLKEEFYRTFLMIAGKIPVWSVLPDLKFLQTNTGLNTAGITSQILSLCNDLIDLGQIDVIPPEDIIKGLLWHICKSSEDPIKAVIKASMIFTYGFNQTKDTSLLCEKIKQGYSKAGIDDYGVDPYKALFDRILEFYEQKDPKGVNLIKNAIFFRLCNYPDVKMPLKNTPKRYLLDKYMRSWNLNKNQVVKLLSYSSWSESEKLLLEKTFIQRLAQMYNHAIQKITKENNFFDKGSEKRNWAILKNKTRQRLLKDPSKIPECSTYLKRRNIVHLDIVKKPQSWELNTLTQTGKRTDRLYRHSHLLGVLGWVFESQLYRRQKATINIETDFLLFESVDKPIDTDRLYMAFQPLKPLSDSCYEQNAVWSKIMILLLYVKNVVNKAELLISNTWGELFLDTIEFANKNNREDQCNEIAKLIQKYSNKNSRFFVYQFSDTYDPKIVYQIKKAYNDLSCPGSKPARIKKKPYLDRL
ncbi:MAG: class I adenylate cyclase [Desulfobacula sp.]|nr:class I adenylate cyclase [Desulfobacula sp.]